MPNWVTGFCDRSGSFILIASKLKSGKWQLSAAFEVLINERYLYLLEILPAYAAHFKVGKIFKTKNGNAVFRVNKINDLKFVVNHFKIVPLLSSKKTTFDLWARAVNLLESGEYKTDKGRVEFISFYASIGRGPSNTVKLEYPNLISATKPVYYLNLGVEELSESWLSGYLSVYCNFDVNSRAPPHMDGN